MRVASAGVTGEELVRAALEENAARSDVQRFLLAYGKAWAPRERPADVPRGSRESGFKDALELARERPGLRYCEGFSLPRGYTELPNRHAWCVDERDEVVDPSPWADPGRPLRECYFGIAIPLDFATPYVEGGAGVLYELTGRMDLLAAELGLTPVP